MERTDTGGLQAGQRVWVLDPDATGGIAWGRLSAVDRGFGFWSSECFVVIVFDGGTIVVTCGERHRGVLWDLAPPDASWPFLDSGRLTPTTSAN